MRLPEGLCSEEEFLSPPEEASLLHAIGGLTLENAQYKAFTARRRIASFGGRYDCSANRLLPAIPMPEWLVPVRDRAAAWAGLDGGQIDHALSPARELRYSITFRTRLSRRR